MVFKADVPEIALLYDSANYLVQITRRESCSPIIWELHVLGFWKALALNESLENKIDISLQEFSQRRNWIRANWASKGYELHIEDNLREVLRGLKTREDGFSALSQETSNAEPVDLSIINLKRDLTSFQKENIFKLLRMPNGSNFSVPGAGKTATTLSVYAYLFKTQKVQRLLVVSPKSAFSSWITENNKIFNSSFSIATYDSSAPPSDADILVTNYEQVLIPRNADRLMRWCKKYRTMVVLDEAHKVKGGRRSITWGQVKKLTNVAERVDLLTGTPMPQSFQDLSNLFSLAWAPLNQEFFNPAKLERIRKGGVFVRTTKDELGLPSINLKVLNIPQGEIQKQIYAALRNRYQGLFSASVADQDALRQKGKAVMTLIAAATNPGLISGITDERSFLGSEDALLGLHWPPTEILQSASLMDQIRHYRDQERPPKYAKLEALVRRKANKNQKIIVWSNYINNLRAVQVRELREFGTALVYGAVKDDDREREIKRFREDPDCVVLITNPQTLGEGISLHDICHNAVYIDRTYNAALYLQSIDRIHRLGLSPEQETNVYFMQSEGTIDLSVANRLERKIRLLASVMDDENLVVSSIPDVHEDFDYEEVLGSDRADLDSAAKHILSNT